MLLYMIQRLVSGSENTVSMRKQDEIIIESEKNLRRISGIIKRNGRKILKNYPITSPQFVALQWVIDRENLTIGELSKKIGLAFSTTTDLVDRMERNGLVQRVRDTDDRRVVRIVALEKGKSIIKEVISKRQQYLGEVLNNLSTEEKETISRSLNTLLVEMRKLNEK